jgi:hypothetical protein
LHKQLIGRLTLSASMAVWLVCCSLFRPQQPLPPPAPTSQTQQPISNQQPVPSKSHARNRPKRLAMRKPPRPHPNPPQATPTAPQVTPPPQVTLENDDVKNKAERLVYQTTQKLRDTKRAELTETAASTYQQAEDLIIAAQRAMADNDYLEASSLAEKASALTEQLPSPH